MKKQRESLSEDLFLDELIFQTFRNRPAIKSALLKGGALTDEHFSYQCPLKLLHLV